MNPFRSSLNDPHYSTDDNARDIIARQMNTNLFISHPHSYEEIEGPVSGWSKDTSTNGDSFISFRLRGNKRLFYLVRTHNNDYDNLAKKVIGKSPLKLTVWSHSPEIEVANDHNISIVYQIEEIRVVVAIETKLILSDGNTVALNVDALQEIKPIVDHFISMFGETSAKLYLQQLVSRSCTSCGQYATAEEYCHKCKAVSCSKCINTSHKHVNQ